jgi:hypothetical protein
MRAALAAGIRRMPFATSRKKETILMKRPDICKGLFIIYFPSPHKLEGPD